MTRRHEDLTSQHTYMTDGGRTIPPYFSDHFVNLSENYFFRSENYVNLSDNELTNRWQLQALIYGDVEPPCVVVLYLKMAK